ncbi:MAG: formyl transferase [Chloroflexi bacterium]|nr:MAG: formyl transferase [Chloroflexota bacterium]
MNLLYLGLPSPLIGWLECHGINVTQSEDRISNPAGFAFIVSYGYRHIIKREVLDLFKDRAINLHISYLPWCRGADPNFWSFMEGTPCGTTIHYLDENMDTGDIIVQERVLMASNETFASSYRKLHESVQGMFKETWDQIANGTCSRRPQPKGGSLHWSKDIEPLRHLLTSGWNTPLSDLESYAFDLQMSIRERNRYVDEINELLPRDEKEK